MQVSSHSLMWLYEAGYIFLVPPKGHPRYTLTKIKKEPYVHNLRQQVAHSLHVSGTCAIGFQKMCLSWVLLSGQVSQQNMATNLQDLCSEWLTTSIHSLHPQEARTTNLMYLWQIAGLVLVL